MSEAFESGSTFWPDDVCDASQAQALVIQALYVGFDAGTSLEGSSPQEKMMAIALQYGDALADQKDLLKKAYDLVLYSPQHWPVSHAWAMAGKWLHAVDLQSQPIKDAWRTGVLLSMAHRVAQAWFVSVDDDEWLQKVDEITTQSWSLMCEESISSACKSFFKM